MAGLYEPLTALKQKRRSSKEIGTMTLEACSRLRFENQLIYRELSEKGYARREAARIENALRTENEGGSFTTVALERAGEGRVYRVNFIIDVALLLLQRREPLADVQFFIGEKLSTAVLKNKEFDAYDRDKQDLQYREYLTALDAMRKGLQQAYHLRI